jgi:tetratricopeptide (TPR) repeat protein
VKRRTDKIKPQVPWLALLLWLAVVTNGLCQETVFTLLKSETRLADQYFQRKNFKGALNLYETIARKRSSAKDIVLKIGRCHYFLKQYREAIAVYDEHVKAGNNLPVQDKFYYAESQASIKSYQAAIGNYRQYLAQVPDDQLVMKKIWQLSNIRYLYEDSLHYAVRPVPLNTESGDLCAVPFRKGLAFMSNRKEVQVVSKIDAASNAPFYKIYHATAFKDTSGVFQYGKPSLFSKELSARLHAGPMAFYDRSRKMVFVATGNNAGANGERTLRLYFATEQEGTWKVTQAFPYNSSNYSISDPAITEDGRVLYFSSDMKGGFGGKDLYWCEYKNGQWTKPMNLGEFVNTPYDEVFPYFHHSGVLYFSSNGHAGLGGLDIFRSDSTVTGFSEPRNAGYPLNSNHDEFGLVIDSLSTHGYFSSNRGKGGVDDDLYEFDMDLQSYPLTITGRVKYKEHSWSDSSTLKPMANARVYLTDNLRGVTVYETVSDSTGNFSITIPYFSMYKVRVRGEDNDENIVSLEIPRHRKLHTVHEIVLIKDTFKEQENQAVK